MKSYTLKLVALSLTLASGAAMAQQRLVVSYPASDISVMSASALPAVSQQHCFTLPEQQSWCVPKPAGAGKMLSQRNRLKKSRYKSLAISVPAGLPVAQAQQMLKQTGFYSHVEQDVMISSAQAQWNETNPDDESFELQTFFADNSEQTPTASSVLSMWRQLKAPQLVSDVYVLDTGFTLHDDISYMDGFNFVTLNDGDVRGPGFLEQEFVKSSCHNVHGLGVASVIGATVNNGLNIAGINGSVNLVPLRVMNCGSGIMSDAAAALEWLSGDSFEELPDFTGQPGVINMSLAGKVGESSCPFYLQNAIDKVTAKGFTVVVAAGNDADEAVNYIPAKCNNVITVGAANEGDDYNPADIANFSNYGEHIDIMAMGQSVPGLYRDNNVAFWDGTSFSAPIVAGVLSAVQKDFSFSAQDWQMLVQLSGVSRWTSNNRCDSVGCGAGILDATTLYRNAQRFENGELNVASFLLNAVPACRHGWMLQHLPQGASLCDQVSIEVNTFVEQSGQQFIRLSSAEANALSQSATRSWIGDYPTKRFVVQKADVLGKTLYAQLCRADMAECSAPVRINTSALADIPAVCQ
ncbi:hypothetical protein E0Z06_13265 [Rheinheimera sp. D18]|uniref:S8 family peptidase n=1 Tax=Rheinheimera sp. D18 TaxID=2545632 RepID=UPI00105389E5|nr:S8 family serine peptidase [Rheinheimera sp. D18]QBL10429.1 hypothetical protein E0Z06_13265 [Rheinheimera sp. D18]